jgi:hypothetical protein
LKRLLDGGCPKILLRYGKRRVGLQQGLHKSTIKLGIFWKVAVEIGIYSLENRILRVSVIPVGAVHETLHPFGFYRTEFTFHPANHVSMSAAREVNSAPEPPCGLVQKIMRGLLGKADFDDLWSTAGVEDADRVGKAGRPRFVPRYVEHLTAELFNITDLLSIKPAKLGRTKAPCTLTRKWSLWHHPQRNTPTDRMLLSRHF